VAAGQRGGAGWRVQGGRRARLHFACSGGSMALTGASARLASLNPSTALTKLEEVARRSEGMGNFEGTRKRGSEGGYCVNREGVLLACLPSLTWLH